jgi:hypothetical protein
MSMLEGFVLGLCAGVVVSYLWVKFIIWSTMRQIEREGIEIKELMAQLQKQKKAMIVEARLEEHQGEFFLYRVDNGEFIAQGATAQEISDRTDIRIRGHAVVVTQSDDVVMERYRATKTVV